MNYLNTDVIHPLYRTPLHKSQSNRSEGGKTFFHKKNFSNRDVLIFLFFQVAIIPYRCICWIKAITKIFVYKILIPL